MHSLRALNPLKQALALIYRPAERTLCNPCLRQFSGKPDRIMSLAPWSYGGFAGLGSDDPFFNGFERAIDRAFARAFDPASTALTWPAETSNKRSSALTVPNLFRSVAGVTPMDVHETDKAYTITADAPGFEPSDVSIEEHEGVLTVRGTKEETREEKDKKGAVLHQERVYRSFARSFTLPETARTDEIQASLDRGVLTVTVPKKEAPAKPEPRRINVSGGAQGSAQVTASQAHDDSTPSDVKVASPAPTAA